MVYVILEIQNGALVLVTIRLEKLLVCIKFCMLYCSFFVLLHDVYFLGCTWYVGYRHTIQ
jgi:hypothetical protein